jgi:hypothetical protein
MSFIDSSATAFAEAIRCEVLANLTHPADPFRRVAEDDVVYWLNVAATYEREGL